jgi:transposase
MGGLGFSMMDGAKDLRRQRTPSVAKEGASMLPELAPPKWSQADLEVFGCLVPPEHYLRRALKAIDFEQLRSKMAIHYSPDLGRPAEDPVFMLKLEFLQYHDNLSDRQVITRAQTDVAYRYFLDLPMKMELPDPSSLCYFRGRLGVEGHLDVFHAIVAQARQHGLVRDRLRLKDATHVIADVAIPTTLALLAQTRDKLLAAAEPFDALRVDGERARIDVVRASTDGQNDEVRLVARVAHLREILAWVDEVTPPEEAVSHRDWQVLEAARRLAHKILADQDDPKAGDRTRSAVEPEVRRGKHGDWYDGYLLDVMMDPDSEVITAINLLPANGHEAADAATLVQQEETAHGNDIAALSIDSVAFQGPVLKELQDPAGLALDLYVPPKPESSTAYFPPEEFREDQQQGTLTCPAGQTTGRRQRNPHDTGWKYRFDGETCAGCPIRERCLGKLSATTGRTVIKNEYEEQYRRMRNKARTAEYAAVRSEHPKIERKLSELVRRHGARRARYRGLAKVLCGQLLAATAANIKRIVHLLCAPRLAREGV